MHGRRYDVVRFFTRQLLNVFAKVGFNHPNTFCFEGMVEIAAGVAVTSGTLVPMMALGVPGGTTAAVMMIVLQYHGMVMGPRLFTTHPELAYGVFVAMAVAYLFMIVTILPLARYMARIVLIETTYLAPIIILVTIVAAFSERQYLFDMALALVFGVIGYIAHKTHYHVTAMLIGFCQELGIRNALCVAGDITAAKPAFDSSLEVLQTGLTPDGDILSEAMSEVVRNTTSQLTRQDLDALIAYLRSLPPLPDEPK